MCVNTAGVLMQAKKSLPSLSNVIFYSHPQHPITTVTSLYNKRLYMLYTKLMSKVTKRIKLCRHLGCRRLESPGCTVMTGPHSGFCLPATAATKPTRCISADFSSYKEH